MKIITLGVLLFLNLNLLAQTKNIDTLKINDHLFYYISNKNNTSLIIFLHGGVKNPIFEKSNQIPDLEYLLEENTSFINEAINNNFNLLIPITNDSLNWLTNSLYIFKTIDKLIQQQGKEYQLKYIAGFSDGGTGSFKIFYQNIPFFDGLIVFNGYPQHNNFYQKVNYSKVKDKKIVFFATSKDKTIPYEFLLTEYCKQKEFNPNTYIYVPNGEHSFKDYTKKDINLLFEIINDSLGNKKNEPIHAFIKNDSIVAFYKFRKKIFRQFGYGQDFLKENRKQLKTLKK